MTGQQKAPSQRKYRNKPHTVDGITFSSKREANRWLELRSAQKNGHISKLRRQVPFSLSVNRIHVCVYIADFVYEKSGVEIVEDTKGVRTDSYVIKRNLMRAIYGIEIQES